MVTLLYFARLRETFGVSSEQAALPPSIDNVGALFEWLRSRGGAWRDELAPGRPVRAAVNQEMATTGTPLADGDEIALFPPVTGG
jgi:molybdopterin synthase sulfur carrier subunit